jgi:hypothetical protein
MEATFMEADDSSPDSTAHLHMHVALGWRWRLRVGLRIKVLKYLVQY